MNKNSPSGKGLRTALQAIGAAIVTYFTGLFALPEFREYTSNFVQTEGVITLISVLAAFGVSAGILAFIQNKLGK